MKRIRALVSMGVVDGDKDYAPIPGAIIELSDAVADDLIRVGYAEEVDETAIDENIPDPDEPGEPAPRPRKRK